MFALKVRQSNIELSPGQSLPLTISCPIFDPDRIGRVFTLPFKVPLTPHNQKALKFANRFDAQAQWDVSTAALMVGGGQYDSGELVALGMNQQALEVMFRNLPLTLLEDLARINVHEILETIAMPSSAPAAKVTLNIPVPPADYNISIETNLYGLTFAASTGMSQLDVANYFKNAINADYPGMASVTIGTTLILDSALLDLYNPEWASLVGFTILSYWTVGKTSQRNFVNHVKNLSIAPATTHVFPIVKWYTFYGGKNSVYGDTVNQLLGVTQFENEPHADETQFQYTFIPFLRLSYILERIRNAADIGYLAGYVDDADFSAIILPNNFSCDKSYNNWEETDEFLNINGFVSSIDLNLHAPKMTALEFLKRLVLGLNLIIEFKEGGLYFRKALDLVQDAPINWDGKVDAKTINYKIKAPKGIKLDYPENNKESYSVGGQLVPYIIGEGKTPISTGFNTFPSKIGLIIANGFGRYPHTEQMGNSPIFGGVNNDMQLHLLFDRGYGTTSAPYNESYVYATYDEIGDDDATVIGALSLELDGEYGLVPVNFADTILLPDASELDLTAILPVSELYRLKRWENARVRFYHPNGTITGILKSVDFAIPMDGGELVPAKATLALIR